MHLLITNSTLELLKGLRDHLDYIPPESKLEMTEVNTTLEEARPEGAPEVRNERCFRVARILTAFFRFFSFRSL